MSINREGETYSGTLQVAGFEIPIGETEYQTKDSRNSVIFEFRSEEPQYSRDGQELVVRFEMWEDSVAGYAKRTGPKFGKVGFTLLNTGVRGVGQSGHAGDDIRQSLRTPEKVAVPDQSLPSSGIPLREDIEHQTRIDPPQSHQQESHSGQSSPNDVAPSDREEADEDVGFLAEHSEYTSNPFSNPDDCAEDWWRDDTARYVAGVSADDVGPGHDKVAHANHRTWRITGYFSNTPDGHIDHSCDVHPDPRDPYPMEANFRAERPEEFETDDYYLKAPNPEDGGGEGSSNLWDYIWGVSKRAAWFSAASFIISSILDSSSPVDQTDRKDLQEWDMKLEHEEGTFPSSPDEPLGVEFIVDNGLTEYDDKNTADVEISSKFTYGVLTYQECRCSFAYPIIRETPRVSVTATYESV